MKRKTMTVSGIAVATFILDKAHYISLTNIARNKNAAEPKDVVKNWMRSKNTVEFLGLWEQLNNPDFKGVEFDPLLIEAGSNSFTYRLPNGLKRPTQKELFQKTGKNGGTFAHKDIAFEIADLLNVAIFGVTANQWKAANPDKTGNMRDDATLNNWLF